MKLRTTLILALALCLGLSACGKEKKEEPAYTQAAVPVLTEAPTQEPTVPPMTEAVYETEPIETLATVPPTEATEAPTEAPTEPEETEAAEETEPEVSTSNFQGTPAKVTGYYEVNLRKKPSVDSEIVKKLRNGTPVTVLETIHNENADWANLGDGWMSMKYLKLEGELPESPDPSLGELATVYNTETLNVRAEATANSEKVAELKNGDIVHVTEIQMVAGVEWGKVEEGWVSMKYILRESSKRNAKPIFNADNIIGGGGYVPPAVQPTFPPPEG